MSSFITRDATQDVFELVLVRPVVAPAGEHPHLAYLWWRAPLQGDRYVQVYINDVLYDVTHDTATRDMYLVVDRTRQQRIELLAVPVDDPEAYWRSQPKLLRSWKPTFNSDARVTLIRDEGLPADTQVAISLNGQESNSGPMWPATAARSGAWSEHGVVYDEALGMGLGLGDFGAGPLGFDGTLWCWTRGDLEVGHHDVRLTAIDQAGRPVSGPLDMSLRIENLPRPAAGFSFHAPFGLTWGPASVTPEQHPDPV